MAGTDISGGFPYLCASTLVYSDLGLIRFFPARPAQWKSGSIKGLRLRGAITLTDLSWDEKGAKAVLVSDKDQTISVETPNGQKGPISLVAGKSKELNL
ncbi:MAG: glycoside hydrolase family 95-like protein [Verrucomicrobiota bacterium]